MKKYLLLGLLILAVLGLILGGYYLRQRGGKPAVPGGGGGGDSPVVLPDGSRPGGGSGAGGGSLGTLAQSFNLVAANPVKDYFADEKGTVVLIQPDGQIVKIFGKEMTTLDSTGVRDLIETAFSADGKMIWARFGDREDPQTSIFDVEAKTWRPLNLKIRSVAWAPKGRTLGYLAQGSKAVILGTWDLSQAKAKPKELITLRARDIDLEWVRPEEFWLVEKGSYEIQSSVWSFNLAKKTLAPVLKDLKGLEVLWNSSGTLALTLSEGQLSLINREGRLVRRLVFITLPSKCAFGEETRSVTSTTPTNATNTKAKTISVREEFLDCAIPKDAREFDGYRLPDDYHKKAVFTEDGLYRIKIADGTITKILEGVGMDAVKLKKTGSKIFFVNRFDDKLYFTSLTQE